MSDKTHTETDRQFPILRLAQFIEPLPDNERLKLCDTPSYSGYLYEPCHTDLKIFIIVMP